MLIFLLWGAFYLAGCADTPVDPGFDDTLPPVETVDEAELELAIDPDLVEAAIQDVEATVGLSASAAEAYVEIQRAQGLFADAQIAYTSGDYPQVLSLATQARSALGTAVLIGRGDGAVVEMVERVKLVRDQLAAGDTDDFDDPAGLQAALDDLIADAEADLARGDAVGAAERSVLAGQRTDRSRDRAGDGSRDRARDGRRDRSRDRERDHTRRPDRDGHGEDGARFAVARALQAVSIAERLLEGQDLTEQQEHMLEAAQRLTEKAQEALDVGHFRQAVMLGNRAVVTALRAVLARDVDEAEVRTIIEVAEANIEAAKAALEANPDEFLRAVLNRAIHAFELGLRKIDDGDFKGVGLVWQAAVSAGVVAG
ncbi:MAG: hypothetical protein D6701_03780 [Gemmatimonadetes bacterium]|nr:MAG: hypothetical protein D6701_03780 [Gemmatimonadota bacterium]